MDANFFLDNSIADILEGYVSRRFTPVDVARACIEQVGRLESQLHAWVCFDEDKLLAAAEQSHRRLVAGEPLRLLEGVPVGVKDIFNTADFPTEMGSPLWKGFTPGNDARAVFHLLRQGALIPGKTVTAEFAVHALGKTRNPHDFSRNPGTSSSGSAVSVASGMVPAALGTQTAGSIVRPASFCGVYGFKPSFGLIPRLGMLKTTDSLDTVGFFAAHLKDLRVLFDSLRVHGPNYPISDAALNDPERQTKGSGRPWRIGVARPAVYQNASAECRSAFDRWLAKLGRDARFEVAGVDLPGELERAHEIHSTIYNKALSYYFSNEFQRAEFVSPVMNELIREGNAIDVSAYQKALKDQEQVAALVDHLLRGFDVVVTLSTADVAPRREVAESPDSALMWNLCYLPVVSAPCFASAEAQPFGLQILTRRYQDYLLLEFCDRLRELDLIPARPNPLAQWLLGGRDSRTPA